MTFEQEDFTKIWKQWEPHRERGRGTARETESLGWRRPRDQERQRVPSHTKLRAVSQAKSWPWIHEELRGLYLYLAKLKVVPENDSFYYTKVLIQYKSSNSIKLIFKNMYI